MKQVLKSGYTIQACNVRGYLIYQPIHHKMGITVEQYRCSIGTFRVYKTKRSIFLKLDNKNDSKNEYPYSYNPHDIYNNVLYIIYCFIILYIFIFIETLVLESTLSSHAYTPHHHSNLHTSHHNLKLTASHLTYINLIYFTILKGVAILRVGKVLSVVHFLRNGTKSFQDFIFTSLSLYLTVLNITLIIINNCSLLNPGPKDPNKISVFYQNIQGLITYSSLGSAHPTMNITKMSELNCFVASQQPDIIIFNETWLKDSVQNSEILPNKDYKIFRHDRSLLTHPPHPSDPKKFRRNGGGVLIAISSSLDLNPKLFISKAKAEILSVVLTLKNSKKICITTCYRVGTLQESNFNEVSDHIQNISCNKSITKHIIVGDFNLDSINWDNNLTSNDLHRKFMNLFEENCLTQILSSPTHCRGNLLDLLLTDAPYIVKDIFTADHNEYIKSDHFAIRFNIDVKGVVKRLKPPKRSVRNFKKADWVAINNDLSGINWDLHIDCTDINIAWCNFKNTLNSICDQHIPKITLKRCNDLP